MILWNSKHPSYITYTSTFLLTGHVGFIRHSTAEATAVAWNTVEGSLRVRCSYCMHGTPVTVAATYSHTVVPGADPGYVKRRGRDPKGGARVADITRK